MKARRGRCVALGTFEERVQLLGDRLGPVRVVVESPRDDGLLALLLGSDGSPACARPPRPELGRRRGRPAVRVDDWEAEAPFRYLRFRDPPYPEEQLVRHWPTIGPLLAAGIEVFAYFQHQDAPDSPRLSRAAARAPSALTFAHRPLRLH